MRSRSVVTGSRNMKELKEQNKKEQRKERNREIFFLKRPNYSNKPFKTEH